MWGDMLYEKEKDGYSHTLMPKYFSDINNIFTLLEKRESSAETETVKTSTQQEQSVSAEELDLMAKKYGLSQKEFDSCKRYAEKKNLPLEQVIRLNAGHYVSSIKSKVITEEAVKINQQKNTQERNNAKPQPVTVKPKKKDSGYNCR